MKKLAFLSIMGVLTLSSFTTNTNVEKKANEDLKMRSWLVYCNGVYTGTITCDCTQTQAQNAGNAMCN